MKLLVLLLAAVVGLTHARNKLIIVGMSGLRHDYVDKEGLPTFKKFKDEGFQAKKVNIPMITNSWPALWTISTGLYPEEHGVIDDAMYDPTIDTPFTAGITTDDTIWMPSKPVWIAAEESGVKTSVSGWPGSGIKHGSVKATHHDDFVAQETVPQTEKRIEDFAQDMYGDADLGFILLPEPDNTAHQTGADTPQVHEALKQNDAFLQFLLDNLEGLGIASTTNIVIIGDHGMTDHNSDQVVYLSDFGVRLGDMRWITNNLFTTGMLLPHPDIIDSTYEKLSYNTSAVMTAYRREFLPDRFHIKNHRRTTPIVLVPKLGYRIQITRPHADIQFERIHLGMHGYDSEEEDMMPAMLAMGPDFEHTVLDKIDSIDIYPMVCSLMKLTTCHGSDGTIEKPQQFVSVTLTDDRPDKLDYKSLNTGPRKKLINPTVQSAASSVLTYNILVSMSVVMLSLWQLL